MQTLISPWGACPTTGWAADQLQGPVSYRMLHRCQCPGWGWAYHTCPWRASNHQGIASQHQAMLSPWISGAWEARPFKSPAECAVALTAQSWPSMACPIPRCHKMYAPNLDDLCDCVQVPICGRWQWPNTRFLMPVGPRGHSGQKLTVIAAYGWEMER